MGFLSYSGILPMILDVALVIVFIVAVVTAAKKGLVKSIYKLASLVITFVLIAVLITPVSNVLEESQAGAVIYRNVSEKLIIQSDTSGEAMGVNAESAWHMPEYIKNSDEIQQLKDSAVSTTTHAVTKIIIKIITVVALFIIIKLIIALIFLFIEGVFKLPVLKSINVLAGIVGALVSVAAVVYILCGIISLDIVVFNSAKSIILETRLIKMFYDYNFLMAMFI